MGLFFESDGFRSSGANLSRVIQHIKGNECCAFISAYLSFKRVLEVRGMEKYGKVNLLNKFIDQTRRIKESYHDKSKECPIEDLSNAGKKRILDVFNEKQNKDLNSELRDLGFGFIDLEGIWGGVHERSKLVIKPNGIGVKDFKNGMVVLGEQFYQEGVLFTDMEGAVYVYFLDNKSRRKAGMFYVLDSDKELEGVLKNGFSKIWRHRGRGFYFASMDERCLEPYVGRFTGYIRSGLEKTLEFRIYEQDCNFITRNSYEPFGIKLPRFLGKQWNHE
jgi:hypothetical protein